MHNHRTRELETRAEAYSYNGMSLQKLIWSSLHGTTTLLLGKALPCMDGSA